jgi:hypothetical protein
MHVVGLYTEEYEGEACLGYFSTEAKAREAASAHFTALAQVYWRPGVVMHPVLVGRPFEAAYVLRTAAIDAGVDTATIVRFCLTSTGL